MRNVFLNFFFFVFSLNNDKIPVMEKQDYFSVGFRSWSNCLTHKHEEHQSELKLFNVAHRAEGCWEAAVWSCGVCGSSSMRPCWVEKRRMASLTSQTHQ